MGIPDPDWLGHRISAATLGEWAAFERQFGPILIHERIDAAIALISSTVAAAAGAKDVTPADFLPRWKPKEPESPDLLWQRIQGILKE